MKNKYLLSGLMISLLSASGYGADQSLTEFSDGKVMPLTTSVIEYSTKDLNFCFATLFSDGVIYLNHSAGVHTVDEAACREISTDKGQSWTKTSLPISGMNAFETKDGKKKIVSCWDFKIANEHSLNIATVGEDGQTIVNEKVPVALPYEGSMHLHRDVLRLKDGRLLVNGYGNRKGNSKHVSFVLESTDDGKSWQYLSRIAEDDSAGEGANETAMIELVNGDLLAYYRTGNGTTPMRQTRSKNGGKTWGKAVEMAPYSAAPSAKVLADGTIVVVSGRPGTYLWIDFSGTGEKYHQFTIYNGSGSSYASVLETAPNEVLVIYDQSDFAGWKNPSSFNQIVGSTYKIVRDDSVKEKSKDHNWATYYTSQDRKLPQELGVAIPGNYQPKGGDKTEAWYEIIQIAERPIPVLRMIHRGAGKLTPGSQWASFASAKNPRDASSVKIGFEFRIVDGGLDSPQFMVSGILSGMNDAPFVWVAFGKDAITYMNNGKSETKKYDVGLGFNAFVLEADTGSNQAKLFKAGEEKPILTWTLSRNKGAGIPLVRFGDGAGSVIGAADLTYIGWSFNE